MKKRERRREREVEREIDEDGDDRWKKTKKLGPARRFPRDKQKDRWKRGKSSLREASRRGPGRLTHRIKLPWFSSVQPRALKHFSIHGGRLASEDHKSGADPHVTRTRVHRREGKDRYRLATLSTHSSYTELHTLRICKAN